MSKQDCKIKCQDCEKIINQEWVYIMIVNNLNHVICNACLSDACGNNAMMSDIGFLGGKKGGPARARALSAERRKEIAQIAAQKRWAKKS